MQPDPLYRLYDLADRLGRVKPVTDAFAWYADINQRREPTECLLALSKGNDPFWAANPSRVRLAEWFAALWERFGFGTGVHLRRVHYVIVSQSPPIVMPNGRPYQNTEGCWALLLGAGKDARYLSLIPRHAVVDQRNPDIVEFLESPQAASTKVRNGGELGRMWGGLPSHPTLKLEAPVIPQRYHIELWTEKSTQNDILEPLTLRYRLNLFAGAGEVSLTRCDELIERAKGSGRPVRILYVSDFDPAGESMPVAAARKMEFAIRERASGLDVQVRKVALTLEQCLEFDLPRTPIKVGERRKDHFEEQFGRGATELDALEALHPGSLEQIVTEEIERYHDKGLEGRKREKVREVNARLQQANAAAAERHAEELRVIQEDYDRLIEVYNDGIKPIAERFSLVQQAIRDELGKLSIVEDWPKPEEGQEDGDPLFDSKRSYEEQAQRFRRQQGKPASQSEYVNIMTNEFLGRLGVPVVKMKRRI